MNTKVWTEFEICDTLQKDLTYRSWAYEGKFFLLKVLKINSIKL